MTPDQSGMAAPQQETPWQFFRKWFGLGAGVLFFGGLSARGLAGLLKWPGRLVELDWWQFFGMLLMFSVGGGVVVALWGLGNRRRPRWRLGLVVLALILFSLLVWPTPFKYYKGRGGELVKVNRITGAKEAIYSPGTKQSP